ncbi:MAG TPA: cytochrome P450 [Actinophytocola sp.]|uniref:cytochrome P450 n=1 Tax=Actinophytocola sp. TaxID=1872138 RepID=UPI002DB60E55|nr:cytochrome P450 [Actinophytocola sp.]HEU5475233.1 cytochrome P450 [Actinophytocola sp.]
MVLAPQPTGRTENARLVEIPRDGLIDLVLRHLPQRPAPLAAPPPGSGLKAVPGERGLPWLGNVLQGLRYGPAFQQLKYRELGPVSWGTMFGFPIVHVVGPDALQIVYLNRDKAFGHGWDFLIGPFFRRGLMLMDFDEHLHHRRIMQQAFTNDRLAGYFGTITRIAEDTVRNWPDGERFPMFPTAKQLSLDIAAEVFMAAEVGAERDRLARAFLQCTHAGSAILRFGVPGGKWRAGLHGRRVLEEYFARMIPAKRAGSGTDLFSALCHAETEDGERFSDEDVISHMIFLIMAAHDTSTITSSAAAYFLGRHPEWQDRARAESLARGDAPLDLESLAGLHTLDLVIKETLRLVPPAPGPFRRAVRDTEILGHFVPAGTMILLGTWTSHLLPEYWTDPLRFDPDRFDEPRREDRGHRFAWLPFGGGVHKCIGLQFGTLEVKTILDAMLRHFRWSFPADYDVPWAFTSLPFPKDNLPIVLNSLKESTNRT